MINFSCKRVKKEDLIRCSFGLSKSEYNLLLFLFKHNKGLTATEIGDKLSIDRTTVQKSIKLLLSKTLVIRKQRNLSKGGYTFIYYSENVNEIKHRMINTVAEWYDNVINEIEMI